MLCMNVNHNSFIMLRRGLMEHIEQGKINGRELSVYVAIHYWADFKYGISWKMSAPFLANFLSEKLQTVKKCLVTLSNKDYIKRFNHRGQRTYYPILINNFELQKGLFVRADKVLKLDGLCVRANFNGTLNVLQENFKCPLSELYVSPIKEVNNIICKYINNKDTPIPDQSEKTPINKKHSFEKSPYYDYEKFKKELPDWNESKIKKYYDSAVNYSGANGGKYLNWVLAVKNWERKDSKETSNINVYEGNIKEEYGF